MEIKICKENEKLLKRLSEGTTLDTSRVIDRIITFYRSRKRAEELHYLNQVIYYEFPKEEDGTIVSDEKETFMLLVPYFKEELERLEEAERTRQCLHGEDAVDDLEEEPS